LLDWEYAGHFPEGMERSSGTLDPEAYRQRGQHLGHAIAAFLSTEYLECYEKWENKEELDTLMKGGELPYPDKMRV
jgi:hypothetical protein